MVYRSVQRQTGQLCYQRTSREDARQKLAPQAAKRWARTVDTLQEAMAIPRHYHQYSYGNGRRGRVTADGRNADKAPLGSGGAWHISNIGPGMVERCRYVPRAAVPTNIIRSSRCAIPGSYLSERAWKAGNGWERCPISADWLPKASDITHCPASVSPVCG